MQATSNTSRFLGATFVAFGSVITVSVASVWTALAPSNVPVSFSGAEYAWIALKQGFSAVMPAMVVLITAVGLVGSVIFSAVALKGICLRAMFKGYTLSVGPFVVLNAIVWTWADASGMELVQAGMLLVPASVMVGITWGLWAPAVLRLTTGVVRRYMRALRRMAIGLDDRQARIAEKRDAKKTARVTMQEQAKKNDGLFFVEARQAPADPETVDHPIHVSFEKEPVVEDPEPESEDRDTDPMDWLTSLPKPAGVPEVEVSEVDGHRYFVGRM